MSLGSTIHIVFNFNILKNQCIKQVSLCFYNLFLEMLSYTYGALCFTNLLSVSQIYST